MAWPVSRSNHMCQMNLVMYSQCQDKMDLDVCMRSLCARRDLMVSMPSVNRVA